MGGRPWHCAMIWQATFAGYCLHFVAVRVQSHVSHHSLDGGERGGHDGGEGGGGGGVQVKKQGGDHGGGETKKK